MVGDWRVSIYFARSSKYITEKTRKNQMPFDLTSLPNTHSDLEEVVYLLQK